jgi:hypothetical protein
MEVLLIVLTAILMGAINALCFALGANVGQAASKGEKVELPAINPMKIAKEHRAKKEAEMEQDKFDTILRNIERFDGTSRGQEDVG